MYKLVKFNKIFVLAFFLLSSAIFSQEIENKNADLKSTKNTKQPASPQAEEGDVKITDGTNTLLRITDEGTFGAIEFKDGVPSVTTNKLYNDGGTLKFNGSSIGSGSGATKIDELTDGKSSGTMVYLGEFAGLSYSGSAGSFDTGLGKSALYSNTIGNHNTAIGYYTLHDSDSPLSNTAFGTKAMEHSNGDYCTAVGSGALWSNSTKDEMVAVGFNALANNEFGDWNTAMGAFALSNNYSGSRNVAVGFNALDTNYNGSYNTAIGYYALRSNTGSDNTAAGYYALASNTSSVGNTAVGYQALASNTTGTDNTAIGYNALTSHTTGHNNVALGSNALVNNSTPNSNTAIGNSALFSNSTGAVNIAVGKEALYNNTSGNYNIGIGYQANYYNQQGSNNTIIGYQAGMGTALHNKSGNVFIGYQAGFYETGSSKLYIENSNSSSPLIWGDFSANKVAINGDFGVGTQNPSDKMHIAANSGQDALHVQIGGSTVFRVYDNGGTAIGNDNKSGTPTNGLYVHGDLHYNGALTSVSDIRFKTNIEPIKNATERLKTIRGVYYDWNREKYPERNFTEKKQIGVLAQEIEKEFPELVRTGKDGYKSVDYVKITPILIEAVKEQDSKIEMQETKLDVHEARIKLLEDETEKIKSVMRETRNSWEDIKIIKSVLSKLTGKEPEIKLSSK